MKSNGVDRRKENFFTVRVSYRNLNNIVKIENIFLFQLGLCDWDAVQTIPYCNHNIIVSCNVLVAADKFLSKTKAARWQAKGFY